MVRWYDERLGGPVIRRVIVDKKLKFFMSDTGSTFDLDLGTKSTVFQTVGKHHVLSRHFQGMPHSVYIQGSTTKIIHDHARAGLAWSFFPVYRETFSFGGAPIDFINHPFTGPLIGFTNRCSLTSCSRQTFRHSPANAAARDVGPLRSSCTTMSQQRNSIDP